MEEEWRDIPGWEGLYQASSFGQVRSVPRERLVQRSAGIVRVRYKGRLLRQDLNKETGYFQVKLVDGARRRTYTVHSVVCLSFNGAAPTGQEAAHNDGDKGNNAARNLRWSTHADNNADQATHGTRAKWDKMPHAKLTEAQTAEIRKSREVGQRLAERYGISASLICMIRKGRRRS